MSVLRNVGGRPRGIHTPQLPAERAWERFIFAELAAVVEMDAAWGWTGRSNKYEGRWNRLYRRRRRPETRSPVEIVKQAAKNFLKRIVRQGGEKRTRTIRYLGCSYNSARAWIEARFLPGMTWDNYGPVWTIDHKRPLASFNLRDEDQRKAAMHYTNLQPLWEEENRRKSATWNPTGGPSRG